MSKKMKAVPKETAYAKLSEEQFTEMDDLITWNSSLSSLKDLSTEGPIEQLEMGFRLGELYCELKETFSKLEKILDDIRPEEDSVDYTDDDESDDDN